MSEYIYASSGELLANIDGEITLARKEIVRCRDCKYNETVPEDSGDWCGYWTDRIYADTRGSGFCAWGERRGE